MQVLNVAIEPEQAAEDRPLDWISIRGFKSIADLDRIELKSLNVLIGANGVGKSNLLGALNFLHSISGGRDHLSRYVLAAGGANNVLHFGSKTTSEMFLETSFGNGTNRYEIRLVPTTDNLLYPTKEVVWFDRTHVDGEYEKDVTTGKNFPAVGCADYQSPRKEVLGWIRACLMEWRVYHFHDTSISSPAKQTASVHDNQFLDATGANLAAFLYMLRQHRQEAYDRIIYSVQRVMPFVEEFRLAPMKENPEWIRLAWKHRSADDYFDVSMLSDGGLRFVLLATLFLQPVDFMPSMILIDEPEFGLHPHAVSLLAGLMQRASTKAQVVVATQSSILVDELEPEDVLVTDLIHGCTKLKRLNAGDLQEWLKEYTLGQLWESERFGGVPNLGE